jgi:hypothetical protein
MITAASIILYAIAVFAGTMMGVGAGQSKGRPVDSATQDNLLVAGVAAILPWLS